MRSARARHDSQPAFVTCHACAGCRWNALRAGLLPSLFDRCSLTPAHRGLRRASRLHYQDDEGLALAHERKAPELAARADIGGAGACVALGELRVCGTSASARLESRVFRF